MDSTGFEANEWPFFWLTHATGLYLDKLEIRLKHVDLDVRRWRVLMCVPPGEARSVSEIADLAIVKLPTMMKLVQRMQESGLVECKARKDDGRVTEVSLTKQGIKAREEAWKVARGIYSTAFSGVSADDLEKLNELLRMVVLRLAR